MPNADFYSIQIVSPEYKPTGSSQLEDYLKKEAEGGVKPEDNEDAPPPKATELYDAPIDRVGGAHVDSKWGEEPNMDRGRQEPFHQNDTTYEATKRERHQVANRAFSNLAAAEAADRKFVSENFAHGKAGDFTARALTLQGHTKEGSATLSENVRKLLSKF